MTSCRGGPECGLCLVRSGRAVPLNAWEWRRLLGPVTQIERTGEYRRERCDRVAARVMYTPRDREGAT